MSKLNATDDFKLTRGTRELIKNAIEETKSNNRFVLCEKIAYMVEEKYNGLNLEYQLERMSLQTTGQILKAIDTFFYKHLRSNFGQ
jgi:hypothetical protein